MTDDNKYTIKDLATNAALQKPVEFQSAFNDLVLDRIKTAVENKKIEIAQSMYNEPPEDIETGNNDEFGAGESELDTEEETNGEES